MLGRRVLLAVFLSAGLLLCSRAGFAGPPSSQTPSTRLAEAQACACPRDVDLEATVQSSEAAPAATPARREKPPTVIVLNLRRASALQLEWLPRIGPASAQRILELRRRKPLLTIADLAKIKGIGQKTIALLRPWLTVSGPSLVCPVSCDVSSGKTDFSTNNPTRAATIAPEPPSCQDHLPLAPAG